MLSRCFKWKVPLWRISALCFLVVLDVTGDKRCLTGSWFSLAFCAIVDWVDEWVVFAQVGFLDASFALQLFVLVYEAKALFSWSSFVISRETEWQKFDWLTIASAVSDASAVQLHLLNKAQTEWCCCEFFLGNPTKTIRVINHSESPFMDFRFFRLGWQSPDRISKQTPSPCSHYSPRPSLHPFTFALQFSFLTLKLSHYRFVFVIQGKFIFPSVACLFHWKKSF